MPAPQPATPLPRARPCADRTRWTQWAVGRIAADEARSVDTHLLHLPVPALPDIAIYLKDESTHPTGSLKHRLARSLFLYGLCNGWIGPKTSIVESSSGSTAVSEAYFARMLGLPFIAVVPASTAAPKIEAIAFHGGRIETVDCPSEVSAAAARLAHELGGHYMDQFTYAERATDWRGNNNIAESLFRQLAHEPHPVPSWIVCGAGTGGTSATIGRYLRLSRVDTRLCLADPVRSVFHRHWHDRAVTRIDGPASLIEGIGRLALEPSFLPDVIDRVEPVDDADSIAAARVASRLLGRRCGGSTGTNLVAAVRLAREMAASGARGSIVTLLCDAGERYSTTCFDDGWVRAHALDLAPATADLEAFFAP